MTAGRFAELLNTRGPGGCAAGLLGMPDDTGVRMNGGRAGAAEGPRGLREALGRYGVAGPSGWAWPGVFDAGDVRPGATLEETHARVTEAAGRLHDAGLVAVGIGGGHDLTLPFVRALAERSAAPPIGVYFDAHLDVRDRPGSGMAFRGLVERCGVRELHAHGVDPYVNTAEHVAWFTAHGGRLGVLGPDDAWPSGDVFVSLDLDVIDASQAPGVSAMNPCGWTVELAERWARSAGRCPGVRSFDIMELAPPLDPSGRTARVAARVLLAFLRGLSERRAPA